VCSGPDQIGGPVPHRWADMMISPVLSVLDSDGWVRPDGRRTQTESLTLAHSVASWCNSSSSRTSNWAARNSSCSGRSRRTRAAPASVRASSLDAPVALRTSGRDRPTGSDAERARVNVVRGLRRAVHRPAGPVGVTHLAGGPHRARFAVGRTGVERFVPP